MVEANPHNDDTFVPNKRICVIFMNGKIDLLVLNPRYARGYEDLTLYLNNDKKIAEDIARLLGMTVMQYDDIDKKKFSAVIRELREIIM